MKIPPCYVIMNDEGACLITVRASERVELWFDDGEFTVHTLVAPQSEEEWAEIYADTEWQRIL